jgi:ParB family chromosome partitioning protein
MEPATAYQVGELTTAPLGALIAAKNGNTRKKKRTRERIRRMAVSIHMHGGVLQNLVVVPEEQDGRQTGRLEVVAGETRRLGLCALRDGWIDDAKGYTDDFPVPILVRARDEATAASTTENIEREDMHPADQFAAFQMVDDCGSVEEVAAMYGVTPVVVKRRLKLANAEPKLLELYRQDGMTLDQLMALCISDDHKVQLRVWEATKGREWDRSPERLRQAITAGEIELDSPLVRLVGIKAYEAAGGQVRRDLFSDRDAGYITDAPLLQRLAVERLEDKATKLKAEGWGWVETRTELQYHELSEFARADKVRRKLTEAEREEWDRLENEAAELDRSLDALYDSGEDEHEATDVAETQQLQRRLTELRSQLRRLEEKYSTWTPDILALAGAIVAVERNGSVVIHRGLVRPQDRKAAKKAIAAHAPHTEATAPAGGEPEPQGHALSEALTRKLTAHRTIALQRVLADNTHVALASLAHNLVQRILGQHRAITALDVQARGCTEELSRYGAETIEQCRAWQELMQLRDAWGERIPGDPARLLAWLIALPPSELCDLLALCAAMAVNAVVSGQGGHPADELAAAVALDMADWWEPTASNYLQQVPKALILDPVSESVSAEAAAPLAKLKKDELVAKAEAQILGKRWVPDVLRLSSVPARAPRAPRAPLKVVAPTSA